MIDNLKKNTKIKVISLLSALVLWIYVMAVVDPEDTRLYENIPITITNLSELTDLGLVVDPDQDLVAAIYVKGNLSDLQKMNINNIDVYGTVNNPIEGQNQLHLKASTSDQVAIDFKSDTIVVNLEKNIKKEINIDVKVEGEYKDDVDTVKLDDESIIISGPRSEVESVKYVRAIFNADTKYSKEYTEKLQLTALDSNLAEVDNITLEFSKVNATISFLQQKEVDVNPVLNNNNSLNLVEGEDFTISPSTVMIKGKASDIEEIDSINTESINIDEFESNSKDVKLEIPDGVSSSDSTIKITMSSDNSLMDTFTYDSDELQILNNADEVTIEDFDVPDTIKVVVKYDTSSQKISKDDLLIYLDLKDGYESDKQYSIKYTLDTDFKDISIDPEYIKSK